MHTLWYNVDCTREVSKELDEENSISKGEHPRKEENTGNDETSRLTTVASSQVRTIDPRASPTRAPSDQRTSRLETNSCFPGCGLVPQQPDNALTMARIAG